MIVIFFPFSFCFRCALAMDVEYNISHSEPLRYLKFSETRGSLLLLLPDHPDLY